MSDLDHKPRTGDKFWDEKRSPLHTGKRTQPNGTIISVDFFAKEVLVRFLVDKGQSPDLEEYSFEQLDGNYSSRYRIYKLYI